jgi:hypothetical protein
MREKEYRIDEEWDNYNKRDKNVNKYIKILIICNKVNINKNNNKIKILN